MKQEARIVNTDFQHVCNWPHGNRKCTAVATREISDSGLPYCPEHYEKVLDNRAMLDFYLRPVTKS